ncbi:MAG: DNA repair protein RecN [Oscillospiraceae bacterium]|nr:DNA repair protein RecN [Oscillospiraceae bacterium]
MLNLLHIENIAVIEKADIEFDGGLSVLTGETGAGKSIVIDALNAVTGGRVSKDIVRTGAKAASVTAVFTQVMSDEWYEENGIEKEDDDQLFVMRKISADGKSSCRINGTPVSVSQLKELGAELIDIHGQNDGRKLLDESFHLKYLDGYCGNDAELGEYKEKYGVLKALRAELDALDMDEGEKERRADMLKFQIDEIERANIVVGEMDEKEARRELLKNASRLTDSVDSVFSALWGSDRADGAVTLTEEAERELDASSKYSDKLGELSSKMADVKYALMDIAEEIRDFRDELDFSPGELDEIEERISTLKRLMRKYGAGEEEILETLERAKEELDDIEYSDEKKLKLEKKLKAALADAEKCAKALSESRKAGALTLEKRIQDELAHLNMKGVKFKVSFEKAELSGTGCDEVRFLMSANSGEEPGRIAKIASGGELSRIMLAMKNVLAENDDVGTMVFDEIDTGVSGIAAQRVGEKLWELGIKRQVLCVTHLPQIAVMADNHFVVEKDSAGERTYTRVSALDTEGRKAELSRLTGGDNITDLTLDSAGQQLAAAQKYKEKK